MKQIMTISAALLFLTIGEVQAQNGILLRASMGSKR